jgi:hypothetical protein
VVTVFSFLRLTENRFATYIKGAAFYELGAHDPMPSLSRSPDAAQARAPTPPPRRAPLGSQRRPADRDGGKPFQRVEVPEVPEFGVFLDFSKGVVLTPGHCARCGTQTVGGSCEVCGFRN